MAISAPASTAWAIVSADAAVTLPGTPAAGDRMYVFAAWKDFSYTAQITSPVTWTEVTEFADGSVTAGNNVGSVKVAAWYRDWQSGDTAPTVDFSSDPTPGATCALLLRKAAGETWDTPTFVTAAIAAATDWSATSSSTITIADAAIVIELAAFRDESATMTRDTDTALDDDGSPAVTWNGNVVELPATHASSTTSTDISADLIHRFVTTGAAGVNLTATGTLTGSETGACLWVHQSVTAAPPPEGYEETILADSPVGYWRLGEASGSAVDSSTNTNDGTVAGGATRDVSGAITEDDGAIAFDGASGTWVSIPDHATVDVGNVFSYEFWVKRAAGGLGTDEWLTFKGGGSPAIYFRASDNLLQLDDDAALAARSNVAETDTTDWHHWVVTHDGSGSSIYRDGTDVTGTTGSVTFVNTTQVLRLACYGSTGTSGNFEGSLDEVALYGARLSSTQVTAHYDAGTAAAGPIIVSWTEAVSTADVWVRALVASRTWTSSATTADVWTRTKSTARSLTEAVTTSDVWTRIGTFPRTFTSTLTTSDVWTRAKGAVRSFTSTVTTSDAWTRAATLGRTLTEAVTTSDVWVGLRLIVRALTEAVTTSDAWTRTATLARALTETVTTGDVWTRVGALTRSWAEAVTTSDVWTGLRLIVRSLTEAVTTSDVWTRVVGAQRSLTSTVTTSDVWTRSGTFLRAIAEAVATADAWVAEKLAGVKIRSWSESVSTTDDWTRTGTFLRAWTSSITTSDAWTRVRSLVRTWTSSVTTSDSWTSLRAIVRGWSESVTTSDAWTRAGSLVRTFAESVTTADDWFAEKLALVGTGVAPIGHAITSIPRGIASRLRPGGRGTGPTPRG